MAIASGDSATVVRHLRGAARQHGRTRTRGREFLPRRLRDQTRSFHALDRAGMVRKRRKR
jgi:hypothetical protein